MNFKPHTQKELQSFNIINDSIYTIEFMNRDYFNGVEDLEKKEAKAIIDDKNEISFIITDDYGMDKFIKDVRVIK